MGSQTTSNEKTIELIKSIMEDIDKSLITFKEEQKIHYEDLNNDEKVLTKELDLLEKKLTLWSSNISNQDQKKGHSIHSKLNNENESNILPQVIKFDVNKQPNFAF
jgi:ribosome-binding ATPase YchF (GTP1/OBG family)